MNKNFNYLVLGRSLKNLADSLLFVFLSLYLFNENRMYSVIFFIVQGSAEVVALFASNLIDRYLKGLKARLLGLQIIQFFLAIAVFLLIYFKSHRAYLLIFYFVIFIFYIINPISYAVESTFMPKLLKKDELSQGYGLMAASGQVTDMVFNAISGILITVMTYIQLSIVTIFSFMLGLIFFGKIRYTESSLLNNDHKNEKLTLKEIYFFIRNDEGNIFLITSIISNFSFSLIYVLYPMWANQINSAMSVETIYGMLIAMGGLGMLIGSLLAPYMKTKSAFLFSFIIKIIGWASLIFTYNNLCLVLISLVIGAIGSGMANNYIYTKLGEKKESDNIKEHRFLIMETLSSLIMPIGYFLSGVFSMYLSLTYIFVFVSLILVLNLILYLFLIRIQDKLTTQS